MCMITLICEQCRRPYQTKPYMAKISNKHFCGMACYAEWQKVHRVGIGRKRVTVSCDYCGKSIERVRSAVGARNFCNRECLGKWRSIHYTNENNAAWRGGHESYRGPNWEAQKQAARNRDGNTCQRCGTRDASMSVHHVKPFRLFADYQEANSLENLITLCNVCHGVAEQEFWATHPEYASIAPFPIYVPVRACRSCGQKFSPRSGATVVCDECCTSTCAHCGEPFYSRKSTFRTVKYCSRKCRNAAIEKPSRERTCPACGKVFTPDRESTKYCSHECYMIRVNPKRQFSEKRKRAAQASNRDEDDKWAG